jgi:hypothetical protein
MKMHHVIHGKKFIFVAAILLTLAAFSNGFSTGFRVVLSVRVSCCCCEHTNTLTWMDALILMVTHAHQRLGVRVSLAIQGQR